LQQLANKGWQQALRDSVPLRRGLNIIDGQISYRAVADAFGMPYASVDSFL
jgi:alanine dehydrogenase